MVGHSNAIDVPLPKLKTRFRNTQRPFSLVDENYPSRAVLKGSLIDDVLPLKMRLKNTRAVWLLEHQFGFSLVPVDISFTRGHDLVS